MVSCRLRFGSNDTGLSNGIRVQMMSQELKLTVDDVKRQGEGNQKIKKPRLINIENLIGSTTIGLRNGTTKKIKARIQKSNDF